METGIALEPKDFEAIAVYSDMDQAAQFESSNALLDQFVKNTLWSAKNNSADLPTDCPTRERHGWTGDAQIFCGTACYLLDYMPFARKYLRLSLIHIFPRVKNEMISAVSLSLRLCNQGICA